MYMNCIYHHFSLWTFVLTLSLALAGCSGQQQKGSPTGHEEPEEGEPELAAHMDYIQKYSHKLGLSVQGKNKELAEFYLHELEERLERVINETPVYEGYQIAELTETMLIPVLEPLDKQVEDENWEVAKKRFREMITTCNSCHKSTDHEFIYVTTGFDNNPFNQVFEKDGED